MNTAITRLIAAKRWTGPGARLHGRPVIAIGYHDLRDDNSFPSWLRVSQQLFDRHLSALSEVGTFIRYSDLFAPNRVDAGRHLYFLLTFDDGYWNNLRLALPLLERHNAPALFFISTAPMVTGTAFWHDRVITPIQAKRLVQLDFTSHGLGRYILPADDEGQRWTAIQQLLTDLKMVGNFEHPTIQAVIADLESIESAVEPPEASEYRPLSESEVRTLALHELCAIGSHAHEHEILTYLDDGDLQNSLSRSKAELERVTDTSISSFAYPNGSVDTRVRNAVRRAGYERAFTTHPGLLSKNADRLLLPRLLVGGYDSETVLMSRINRLLWRGWLR